MDATTLRWILAIIGVVVIGGLYGYSLWQDRRRRHAAIRNLTREELEAGFIEDDALREELAALGTTVEEKGGAVDVCDIRIHPGQEPEATVEDIPASSAIETAGSGEADDDSSAQASDSLIGEHCVAHILKQREDRPLSGDAILLACERCGLSLDEDRFFAPADSGRTPPYRCANLSQSGSFASIHEAAFKTQGLLCWFDPQQQPDPLRSYEQMLKGIDELVRELDLKVYNQDLELLTLQHVTGIRHRLQGEPETPPDD